MTAATAVPSSIPPLRIAILGAGRIGSAFAFHLAQTGRHDVTVVARPDSVRLRQLERDRAIVDIKGGRASVRVASRLDEMVPYDLVLVTLLAHQADGLLPVLQRCAGGCILFMFNTFHPERLQRAVGVERCSLGMPFVQATLTDDGRLEATIGAAGQRTLMGRQRWVDVFDAAGLPATLDRDMPLWLRCHVPLCVALESVSIAGERRGSGASWAQSIVLARGMDACFTLIEVLGYEVYPKTKRRIRSTPTLVVAMTLWSLSRVRPFRRLMATGEAECRSLVHSMVVAAASATTPVDVSAIQAMLPHP